VPWQAERDPSGDLPAAEWTEFDLKKQEWHIRAERMQARVQHAVSLSKQATSVLEELQPPTGDTRYLFQSVRTWIKPMSANTVGTAPKRRAAPRAGWTPGSCSPPVRQVAMVTEGSLCNHQRVKFSSLASLMFCLALLCARGLGLHFHEPDHHAAGAIFGGAMHVQHDASAADAHIESHHSESRSIHGADDVDIDWVGASGNSMPAVYLCLAFVLRVAVAFVDPPALRRWESVPLRPPRSRIAALIPPSRGPPSLS
jgi:hypothetical protein